MNRCGKLILLTTFVLGWTTYGFAQRERSSVTPDDAGGWTVAAYLGGARTSSSSLAISQPALGNELTFEDVQFRSSHSTLRFITAFAAATSYAVPHSSESRRSLFT